MAENKTDKPVKPPLNVPPPIVTLLLLGLCVGIGLAFPRQIFEQDWIQFALGIPVLALGLGLGLTAWRALSRAGTDERFAKPTSVIVQDGPFAQTRNPMNLSLVLLYLGVVFIVDVAWALVGLPVLILYLHYGVIRREERYLEDRFGDEYVNYKDRVPRWVPGL